jgi:hypothetical protein
LHGGVWRDEISLFPSWNWQVKFFGGIPYREKSWNLKPFDKLKVELTKTKENWIELSKWIPGSINISMSYSNGKLQCLILIFLIVKQKNDCKHSSICPTNNPFHVLIEFKVIQVLLDDPDDTWEVPKEILAKLERLSSSTTDPLQMLLFSQFSSGFFHTQNWCSSRLIPECTWEPAGLAEQLLRQAASSCWDSSSSLVPKTLISNKELK